MATLVLGLAGQAIGQAALGSTAFSLFGASISGATIGGLIGGALGSYVDGALFRAPDVSREGPRLSEAPLLTSQEGAAVPRIYGRGRVGGQVIWASRYLETATTRTQKVGGKGGGGQKVSETEYAYSVSFAVGLCDGPISGIGRIWADGRALDSTGQTLRLYKGTDDQTPDSLIEAIEGAGVTPAYKDLAYLVFEDFPLGPYGNRVPQIQVEVFRALTGDDPDALEARARAVCLTPGSGEFSLAVEPVFHDLGGGRSAALNVNNSAGRADALASLDQLEELLSGLTDVSLVVTWFGSDLRMGACRLKPGVEEAVKETYPLVWSVDGVDRSSAHLISRDEEGRVHFGGTPSDQTVVAMIAALKARGLKVHLYPFILMDVPPGNGLPDPYDLEADDQPAFPWRGRITLDPAPGVTGSPDKTGAAETQVAAFFGAAGPGDFSVNTAGKSVAFTGDEDDWGLRRFILHYAHLAAVAGGVDGFFLGSELRGLTTARSGASAYPAVDALKALAGDVRGILGGAANISYGADWSEYFGHQPADGSGDVHFHLDPFWADANVDMVAVDLYHPLSDWRDGTAHLDAAAGWSRPEARDYLMAQIEGGEGYDWYYASTEDRDAQIRTPITDGAYAKPWVFRSKDLRAWWDNPHYDRPGGVEAGSPTPWVPRSKPIWLSEVGCPAVDKGANEPNVFYDPKSSESKLPHYSRGTPNDLQQRRYLEAVQAYWAPGAGNNPSSEVYGGPMIETGAIFLWSWDVRPYPDFPARAGVWADAANWRLGHWLNGRLGLVPLAELVTRLAGPAAASVDASALQGLVPGYTLDAPMSPRAAIEPLAAAYHFDAVDTGTIIRFTDAASAPLISLAAGAFADRGEGRPALDLLRAQETDLPRSARLSYVDLSTDYRIAAVESRKLAGASNRIIDETVPLVLDQPAATALADRLLQGAWGARETATFSLPPSYAHVDVGDRLAFDFGGYARQFKVTRITDAQAREIEAVSFDPSLSDAPAGPDRVLSPPDVTVFGRPALIFLDVPDLTGAGSERAGYVAAAAVPWPGRVALYKSPQADGFTLHAQLRLPAIVGALLYDLYAGPLFRWDEGNEIYVRLHSGGLASAGRDAVLNGANACAIETGAGAWEIVQYADAELIDTDTYRLSGLLRGQLGTQAAMADPVAAGARFVLLDGAVAPAGLSDAERGLTLNYRCGPAARSIGDVSYVGAAHTFASVPLRPLSPVHVRGQRLADDSLALTWVRRSRIAADDWDQSEVALGETEERYALEVYDGAALVRTVDVTAPAWTYGIADQTSDFGGPAPAPVTVRVFQISTAAGRGSPANAQVWA